MLKNITLEVSLKPFKNTSPEYIDAIIRKMFNRWKPLMKETEGVSVMMFSADGSELLDYRGNLSDSFEWAYYVGGANQKEPDHVDSDPDGLGLHTVGYKYMDNPPIMTYEILKNIVESIKRIGAEIYPDKNIRVGTTVDPGPEFAVSPFKYERHNEICTGNDMGKGTMICAYAKLNGDDVSYAAFPEGIPDGLPFGIFLGRQAKAFMEDIGFDYIWLSNGLGFGRETWSPVGATFDGERFDGSAIEGVREDVLEFWRLFKENCPDFPVEVRGTNMSVGIDFATDAVPLEDIYENVEGILPPPNSPWAALNFDFGLELMGYMSRMAKVPDDEYLYRFYIHDPWWRNSPWYDRYNRQPHDIYLPLAISRLDENGKVKNPTHMSFLTVDNSFGEMPDSCVYEPLPHLMRGLKEMPDEIAPLVWVYPFSEYSACRSEVGMCEMYAEDWFIRGAINCGLPLSMVTATDSFIKHDKRLYENSIIVTPVPLADSRFEKEIIDYKKYGGKIIFYGNTKRAGKAFLKEMHLSNTDGISGEIEIATADKVIGKIIHNPITSGGELCTVAEKPLITAAKRTVMARNENAVWVRGTVSREYENDTSYFASEQLMTKALSLLGWEFVYEKYAEEKNPVIMLHRFDNAYVFSSFLNSTTVETRIKTPLGAPILDGYETVIKDGYATYHFPKAERRECRVFVVQEDGIVGCREVAPVSWQIRRRVEVSGLKNATVRFFAESYCKSEVEPILNSEQDFYFVGEKFDGDYVTDGGVTYYEARNVTGTLVFSMPDKKHNHQ